MHLNKITLMSSYLERPYVNELDLRDDTDGSRDIDRALDTDRE